MAKLVNRYYLGMVQPGKGAGFACESFCKSCILADLRRQDLQGYEPVKLFLPGLINSSHTAMSQQFDNFELGELLSELIRLKRHESTRRCGTSRITITYVRRTGLFVFATVLHPGFHQAL